QVLARLVTIPGDGRLQGDDPMGRIDQPPRTDLAGEMAFRRQATREQAEDPRFYAAKFSLGAEGDWEITVVVEGPEGAGEVSFEVVVRQAGLLGNPYLILFLSLVPIGLVGWWLRRSSDPSSPSSRPEG
ncbi:MAG: hypothetical protein HKO65_12980, partial [Gemmatimonadetes bacterium]|nr:hypothetical protein [Gemmatimonadota bacterium]